MDFITLLDGIVLVVVSRISAMLAMYRGLIREIVFSIVSWAAAAGAAYFLYKPVLPMVKQYINNDYVALGRDCWSDISRSFSSSSVTSR